MHLTEWQQFLRTTHPQLVLQEERIVSFTDAAREREAAAQGTVICDLSHWGLLQLQGADTVNFLQGQVTNDVRLLTGNNAHYSGYCSPKGRLLAMFLALKQDNYLYLQMPKSLIEPIMKRLKMFVMRSIVDIQDTSDHIIKLGVAGPQADALLTKVFGQLPRQEYEFLTLPNGSLLKLPGAARYELFLKGEHAPAIWNALLEESVPVGAAVWDWLEIQAGIPEINLQTQEEFVPQMLNLDALQAINYKKGCYTGQEIVARTHYLGKVKRRTQLAHLNSGTRPQLNDDVVDVNGQAIGKIVRIAPALTEGFDILVECRLENVGADAVFWQHTALEFKPLPYIVAED